MEEMSSRNPFDLDESLINLEGDTDQIKLMRLICAKEVLKATTLIKAEAYRDKPKNFWLIKDTEASHMYNVATAGGVFRSLVVSEDPRLLPVYVALPIVFATPLKRIYELISDRLQPADLRNCVYALITKELKDPKLLKEIEKTDGIVLDEILFPPKPKGEVAETSSVSEPKAAEDPRRETLINLVEERVQDEALGFPAVTQNAVLIGVRDGFEKGREALVVGSGYRDALVGIIRLISYFYHKILVFIDQVEMWEMFSDTERAAFLGVMTELGFLSGGRCMFVFAGELSAYKAFDPNFTKGYKKVNLDLRLTYTDLDTLTSVAGVERMLTDFLEADPIRREKGLHPFTRSDVENLVKQPKGNILKILNEAKKLFEQYRAGKKR